MLHGRTSDIIVLATPELSYERLANNLTFTWTAVDDAESYAYILRNGTTEVESGEVTDLSITFKSLESGTYTFVLTAEIDQPGYASSDAATVDVDFVWSDPVAWSVVGTYTSEMVGSSWTAKLVAYLDGTYTLEDWYGVEGYNLNFSYDEATDCYVLSSEYDDNEKSTATWGQVFTGRTSKPTYMFLYKTDALWLEESEGSIELWPYYSDYYTDTFTWNTLQTTGLDGTWTMTTSATSELENDAYTPEQLDETVTCKITKIDNNTYQFPALYFSIWDEGADEADCSYMTVTVDWAKNTLTVKPTKNLWGYYTLAGDASTSTNIVGTINADGSLTFTGWAAYYGSTKYVYDGTVTFSR